MVSYYVVAFVALLAVAYADDQPCSKQLEAELQCMVTLKTGAEAQKLKEAVKQVHKTCAPSIPESCHAGMEAVHECATDLAKNVDSNANLKDSKKEAEAAVDECYAKHPPSVFKAFEEIFMPKHHMPHFGKFRKFKHHKKGHHGGKGGKNDTMSSSEESSAENTSSEQSSSSSNETSSSSEHHGGKKWHRGCRHGRRHGGRHGGWEHKNASSSESGSSSKENNTSSGSRSKEGSSKEGSSFEKKFKKHGMKPECRPTKEQKKCIFKELKKLGNDTQLVETINTIVNQKRKCKQLITWSCSDKTPFREFCLFKKTKSFRKAFIQELESCVEKKGFTLPPFLLRTHGDVSKVIEATSPLPPVAST